MKTLLVFILAFGFLHTGAQSSDPALNKRINEYIKLNRELKFSELMEYIHPGLFTIAPKEQLTEAFEKAYDGEDMKITMDSISIIDISAVYMHNGGSYRKVNYFVALTFFMKDEELMNDSSFSEMMTAQMVEMYPDKKIKFSKDKRSFTLSGKDVLLAIKDDEKSQWMFLGYDKSKAEILGGLFPKEVVAHFGLND